MVVTEDKIVLTLAQNIMDTILYWQQLLPSLLLSSDCHDPKVVKNGKFSTFVTSLDVTDQHIKREKLRFLLISTCLDPKFIK